MAGLIVLKGNSVVSWAMEDLTGIVLTAAGAFAATNLDDLLVLCVLFLSAKACAVPGLWKIWVGQYLGIGIMAVAAAAAAWALTPVPVEWVGLLGLVPLAWVATHWPSPPARPRIYLSPEVVLPGVVPYDVRRDYRREGAAGERRDRHGVSLAHRYCPGESYCLQTVP
ncbi:hypothetical protein GCM10007170_39270 [Arthrobacter liuii]|uniref:Cadmium resistance transporter n=1 Tax=Arthrobacter liuii TaxID=1476996 RepID=A0ABQ2AZV9_9MICC|nr:hypothetical protein GCM10007170_39270 [Arthrobacter liuii]